MDDAGSGVPADLAFLQWLIDEAGCLSPRPIPGNQWAAVLPKMFTHAIAVGPMFDRCSITTHWCYGTIGEAKAALDAWNGVGEPVGWLRHPASGRRRAQENDEIDEHGRPVAAGDVYIRS